MTHIEKHYEIAGALDDAPSVQEITIRLQAQEQNRQSAVLTSSGHPRKTYIDPDGRPRRKEFRRDVERTHSKTVHFDDYTNALIDFTKTRINETNASQKTTVDDIIYDAVQYWFKHERQDILNTFESIYTFKSLKS